MALECGTLTPAQVMQDLPDSATGIGNADGGFLGALLPRQALANSRNVPAVTLLREVGLQRAFDQLRALGLHDLDGSAARFGLSMAIGSLPTSLERLMRAYATLAEDGAAQDLNWIQGQASASPPRPIIRLDVARQVVQFLSDRNRASAEFSALWLHGISVHRRTENRHVARLPRCLGGRLVAGVRSGGLGRPRRRLAQ